MIASQLFPGLSSNQQVAGHCSPANACFTTKAQARLDLKICLLQHHQNQHPWRQLVYPFLHRFQQVHSHVAFCSDLR